MNIFFKILTIFCILISLLVYFNKKEHFNDIKYVKFNSHGVTSDMYISKDKKYIKKVVAKFKEYDVVKREIYILKLLNKHNYKWAPKIISFNNNEIVSTYCGEEVNSDNIPHDYLTQINSILIDLKKHNIKHNDIKINEILIKDNKIHLCDFGWASINDDFSLGINISKTKKPYGIIKDSNIIHTLDKIFKKSKFYKKYGSIIPIFIIVHDRLKVLKKSVLSYNRLIKTPFEIIYFDSKSTYKPTIKYLKEQERKGIKVYWSKTNNHKNVYKAVREYLLQNSDIKYYIVTDPDIELDNVNGDILEYYIYLLNKYKLNGVGPAIRIDDIPDYYPKKKAVLKQQSYHWDPKITKHKKISFKNTNYEIEISPIDTTFQLLRSDYIPINFPNKNCFRCLAPYSARHLDWYIDPNNMSGDEIYYSNNAKKISHWGRNIHDIRIDSPLQIKESFIGNNNYNKELHIIIDWKQKYKKDYILKKIKDNKLSLHKFIEHKKLNDKATIMSKFYNMAVDDFRGETTFNIYLLNDYNPIYKLRNTSKGKRLVNTKIFDLKKTLRNNDYSIHGTDNIQETKDNLVALNLFDTYYEQKRFDSLSHVFDILNSNSKLKWIVMRNFEDMPNKILIDEHLDVDLLVNDYYLVKRLLDASSATNNRFEDGKHRILNHVIINNKKVLFDFRCVGDNYYDINFQKNMIATRVKYKNFYIPNKLNHLYGLIYHAIIHKNKISNSYKKIFTTNNISCDKNNLKKLLDQFMNNNNYKYVKPEPSVGFNFNADLR